MTAYFKIIFWTVTKLKVLLYEFTKDFVLTSGGCRDLGRAISRV